jgi:hypothetical protein
VGAIACGALYEPLVEIVPVVAFPPATPFTIQVTAEFELPVTVAVKFWAANGPREALMGDTATVTGPVMPPVLLFTPLQP